MTPAQIAKIMALVEEYAIERFHGGPEVIAKARAAVEAALRDAPGQAAPIAEARKADDVDRLLHQVFLLCEAVEDAPAIAPKNEHERGFDRGRRFEAKQIRRAIGDWFQWTFCGHSFMGKPVLAATPSAPTAVEPDKRAERDAFQAWANREGYDTAYNYDTERSRWVFFNPMTADLFKAWRASKGTP